MLVAANGPELSSEIVTELRKIETEAGAEVEFVLESDWHHLYAKQWADNFKKATVLFPSTRGWRFHEKEDFPKKILDREHPEIPSLQEGCITLIPWLGFAQRRTEHPDDKRRGEYSVYLPQHKILFMYDIFIPALPWRRYVWLPANPDDKERTPWSNFGPERGFRPDDAKLCSDSAKRLLELDIETLVFAHGDVDYGAIRKSKESVTKALADLKTLVNDKIIM